MQDVKSALSSNFKSIFGESLGITGVSNVKSEDPSASDGDDKKKKLGIGLGVGLGVGIPVVVAVVAFLVMRRKDQNVSPGGQAPSS